MLVQLPSKLQDNFAPPMLVSSLFASPRLWKPPDIGILEVNMNMDFFGGKIGIGIIIRNHLRISLLAKYIPRPGRLWLIIGHY